MIRVTFLKGAFVVKGLTVQYNQFGKPLDVLQLIKKDVHAPKAGEVLVRMALRPINPSDLIPITGAYAHRIPLPQVPGYEGVGVIVEVGSGVSPEMIGRRVLPLRGEGTWQEYVTTSAAHAVPVADTIADSIAAQLYINPVTAFLTATHVLGLQPNDSLLVNAGGSAIGRVYAQLAKLLGFRLIAITRNDLHTKDLLTLGAWRVLNTAELPLKETIREWTEGKGATAAIDSIGGADGTALAYCLKTGGTLLTIGLLSGEQINWQAISREVNIRPALFHLRHWNREATNEAWHAVFRQLINWVQAGQLSFQQPNAVYVLADTKQAVAAIENKQHQGKIYLQS